MTTPLVESLGINPSRQGTIWNEIFANRLCLPIVDQAMIDWQDISDEKGIKHLILYSELANKIGYIKKQNSQNQEEKEYWQSIFSNNISGNSESQKILFRELEKLDPNYKSSIDLILKTYKLVEELGKVLKREQPTIVRNCTEVYEICKNWQADPLEVFDKNALEIKNNLFEFLSTSRKSGLPFSSSDLVNSLKSFDIKIPTNFSTDFTKYSKQFAVTSDKYFVNLVDRNSFVFGVLSSLYPQKVENLEETNKSNFLMEYSLEKGIYNSTQTDKIIQKINSIFTKLPDFYTT